MKRLKLHCLSLKTAIDFQHAYQNLSGTIKSFIPPSLNLIALSKNKIMKTMNTFI